MVNVNWFDCERTNLQGITRVEGPVAMGPETATGRRLFDGVDSQSSMDFYQDIAVVAFPLPVGGAVTGATLRGAGEVYFDSIAMLVFLLLGARYLELVARQRALKVGPIVGDDYTVLSGIKAGERVVEHALARWWMRCGVQPAAMIGHSQNFFRMNMNATSSRMVSTATSELILHGFGSRPRRPALVLALGFLVLIAIGTGLLILPVSAVSGEWTTPVTASPYFNSVSSTLWPPTSKAPAS